MAEAAKPSFERVLRGPIGLFRHGPVPATITGIAHGCDAARRG